MMRLLARFHRCRLSETSYWLPYERQLHEVMIHDGRPASIRDILVDQFATLFKAYRSRRVSEVAAIYSYRCSLFYDVTDEFNLCEIRASNAEGVVQFCGGILSQIRLTPKITVPNPNRFRLENLTIDRIHISPVVQPPPGIGWVAMLEADGLIRRHGAPRQSANLPEASLAHRQYGELFAQCAEAVFVFKSESFYFLPPDASFCENGRRASTWIPVLDLRELGGLAITTCDNGDVVVSRVAGSAVAWSEPDLVTAIMRLHTEFGKTT